MSKCIHGVSLRHSCDQCLNLNRPGVGSELYRLECERDTLRTANQRLDLEIGRLQLIVAEQSVRRFVGDGDQRKMDELVAAGIRADQQEIKRLEGEVARLREALLNIAENSDDQGAIDHARSALSTANGEVTE